MLNDNEKLNELSIEVLKKAILHNTSIPSPFYRIYF